MMPGIAGGDNCDDNFSDNYNDAARESRPVLPAALAAQPSLATKRSTVGCG
jgi:hypothetical protein